MIYYQKMNIIYNFVILNFPRIFELVKFAFIFVRCVFHSSAPQTFQHWPRNLSLTS